MVVSSLFSPSVMISGTPPPRLAMPVARTEHSPQREFRPARLGAVAEIKNLLMRRVRGATRRVTRPRLHA